MENEKQSIISWVKDHKKQLIIAGVSISALVLSMLAVRNKETLIERWNEVNDAIDDIAKKADTNLVDEADVISTVIDGNDRVMEQADVIEKTACEVRKHIRNLAPGYHPSLEKLETALENEIELLPNQTWVKQYIKGQVPAA